jgi:hypothetical protein
MAVNTISKTGTGSSSIYAVDYFRCPVNVGIQAVLSGTATYTVEYTLDDITSDSFSASTATWTGATADLTGASASKNGLLTVPCRGIRLTIASGTGSVVATICQAGIG